MKIYPSFCKMQNGLAIFWQCLRGTATIGRGQKLILGQK